MKVDNKYSPILVTGIERSGSSIVARIIASCGAFTGKVTAMQENIAIKTLVDSFYEFNNVDKRGQSELPNIEYTGIPTYWKDKVSAILNEDNWKEDQKWMYKSARIAQIYPVWQYAFPTAKYIIVRRKTSDIIQSCLKTGYMIAYKDAEGWLGWIHKHEDLFVGMLSAGLNCKQVWPERMVNGDYSQIREMLEWLGLEWNEKIIPFVTPLLKNSTQKRKGDT